MTVWVTELRRSGKFWFQLGKHASPRAIRCAELQETTLKGAAISTHKNAWELTNAYARNITNGLLVATFVLFVLHYFNLTADFPHYTWPDWARYHDEGWYTGAAARQIFANQWRLEGDFNPGVAIPVFPALAWVVFRFTGVGITALHALNVTLFGLTLVTLWMLVRRSASDLSAAGAVFLCACSPYYFAFSRLGIVEPLLALEFLLVLLVASYVPSSSSRLGYAGWSLSIGVLLSLIILTKASGLFLFPSVVFLLAAKRDFDPLQSAKSIVPPLGIAGMVWLAYYEFVQRAGYGGDFHHMFVVNNGHVHRFNLVKVVLMVLRDSPSLGPVLFFSSIAALALSVLLRARQSSLLLACVLGAGGYEAFIVYHRRPEPHYFLILLPLLAAVLAMSLDALAALPSRYIRLGSLALVLMITVSCAGQIVTLVKWSTSPSFSYVRAAEAVFSQIDRDPSGNRVILGRPSEEVGLLAGEAGVYVTDEFNTAPLKDEIERYHPGWLIAFDDVPTVTRQAVQGMYSMQLVSTEPAYGDDWAHHQLLLYKLVAVNPRLEEAKP